MLLHELIRVAETSTVLNKGHNMVLFARNFQNARAKVLMPWKSTGGLHQIGSGVEAGDQILCN